MEFNTNFPETKIEVHPTHNKPDNAWREIANSVRCETLRPLNVSSQIPYDRVRFVCMSDTHLSKINFPIPEGDVFLHAGDFTRFGTRQEIIKFNNWLGTLTHQHKIIIAGNHEIGLDNTCNIFEHSFPPENRTKAEDLKKLLTNCTYLEDSSVEIKGIKIYGSPWQPFFRGWAFNVERGEKILEKWNCIPSDTDILMTHGPPVGYCDTLANNNKHVGCTELLSTIQKRVKPKFAVFGHIHEGYGIKTDGTTIFINASTCTKDYFAKNLPIVFDYPIPELQTSKKSSWLDNLICCCCFFCD